MEIIDIFDENGKSLNEILEGYILASLQSAINNESLLTKRESNA